ncbi:MAG: response regulator [Gemmatimonadaceae bacterium]
MAFNVLVVDDSAVMRTMVIRTLKMSGVPIANIYQAGNGEDGLNMLHEQWVDLLLLDVNMPIMDGEEMLQHVRANPDTKDLSVIVVSTEGSEIRLANLQALGASVVRKPFTPVMLRNVIIQATGVTDVEYYGAGAASDSGSDF